MKRTGSMKGVAIGFLGAAIYKLKTKSQKAVIESIILTAFIQVTGFSSAIKSPKECGISF